MFSNKLVENNFLSIDKYLLDTASCDDGDKTIMYRELVLTGKKMWLCNLCTFATRPIKVLFSYFKLLLSCCA